ncbi:hypothetical protein AKUH3B111A_PLPX00240 (plasmid) [Apilactobacillus kunkeei]|nr:hypothetical protein AKUH3B111A_PLPX00240 [Apilactobacillus kunkeei]CAI2677798.1 hypothetical protein AKUH3B103M_PLPX00250 [Apilactobacillus kunkeei]CAI2678147.1 hypothetical protein AKUH3B104X_PLPX00250 [Apilactobacillus kunkeei]
MNVAPSIIRVFNKGKSVKKFVSDYSINTIFIIKKQLRNSNSITINQKAFNKNTSIRVKYPKLTIEENNVIEYEKKSIMALFFIHRPHKLLNCNVLF